MTWRSFVKHGLLIALFFVADQIIKQALVASGIHLELVKNSLLTLSIQPSLNRHFALSIPSPYWLILLVVFVLLVVLVRIWILYVRTGRHEAIWIDLILAGAIGNLFDRIFWGGVIDWLELGLLTLTWSSVNLADGLVLLGAIGWLFSAGARSAAKARRI